MTFAYVITQYTRYS